MQHANAAVDEVRRAEFFRKGKAGRSLVRGKTLVATEPVGKPRQHQTNVERVVRIEPASDESLSAERKLGPTVDVSV